MSAWVVSKPHIDLLVSAALERSIAVKFATIAKIATVTTANASRVGRMLWCENMISVAHRYEQERDDAAIHAYVQQLLEYRFAFYPGVRDSAIAQALACYDYQACEHPAYPRSPAAFFVQQLTNALGAPDGADAEPWGFDTEDAVRAAIAKTGGAR